MNAGSAEFSPLARNIDEAHAAEHGNMRPQLAHVRSRRPASPTRHLLQVSGFGLQGFRLRIGPQAEKNADLMSMSTPKASGAQLGQNLGPHLGPNLGQNLSSNQSSN